MKRSDLDDFVKCYNADDITKREETYNEKTNPDGRWRKFSVDEFINKEKNSMDVTWIKTDDFDASIPLSQWLDEIAAKSNGIAGDVEQLQNLLSNITE